MTDKREWRLDIAKRLLIAAGIEPEPITFEHQARSILGTFERAVPHSDQWIIVADDQEPALWLLDGQVLCRVTLSLENDAPIVQVEQINVATGVKAFVSEEHADDNGRPVLRWAWAFEIAGRDKPLILVGNETEWTAAENAEDQPQSENYQLGLAVARAAGWKSG